MLDLPTKQRMARSIRHLENTIMADILKEPHDVTFASYTPTDSHFGPLETRKIDPTRREKHLFPRGSAFEMSIKPTTTVWLTFPLAGIVEREKFIQLISKRPNLYQYAAVRFQNGHLGKGYNVWIELLHKSFDISELSDASIKNVIGHADVYCTATIHVAISDLLLFDLV